VREYTVTEACYVPVGPGFKWKFAGQRVRLAAEDAAELGDLVVPVPDRVQILNTLTPPDVEGVAVQALTEAGLEAGVQKLNTPKGRKAKADQPDDPEVEAPPVGEVVDAGEPGAADERAAGQD
jgi:hypothetical protein